MTPRAEVVLGPGERFAEGPTWDERQQALVFVDIPRGQVHTWWPGDGRLRGFGVGRPLGAAVLARDDGFGLAVAEGLARCDGDGADVRVLHELVRPAPDRRMNDASVDPAGRLVAGSMDKGAPGSAGLFVLDHDGTVRRVLDELTVSNGLGWSPSGTTMYHVDTASGGVDAYDYDLDDGVPARRRRLAEVRRGRPDGLTVDADGCVWVALWLGGAVQRFSPEGRLLETVELPTSRVTSCAFGGSDLSTLFVTTARVDGADGPPHPSDPAGALFALPCAPGGTATPRWVA